MDGAAKLAMLMNSLEERGATNFAAVMNGLEEGGGGKLGTILASMSSGEIKKFAQILNTAGDEKIRGMCVLINRCTPAEFLTAWRDAAKLQGGGGCFKVLAGLLLAAGAAAGCAFAAGG